MDGYEIRGTEDVTYSIQCIIYSTDLDLIWFLDSDQIKPYRLTRLTVNLSSYQFF